MTAMIHREPQRSPNALTSAQPARLAGRNFGASSLSFARQVLGVALCRSFRGDVNAGVAAAMSRLHACLAAVTHPPTTAPAQRLPRGDAGFVGLVLALVLGLISGTIRSDDPR